MKSSPTEATVLKQRYEIVREIGRGGFGRTFLGIDNCVTPGRQCAIKKLQPLLGESQQFQQVRERFHREATALAQLSRDCRQIPHFYDRFSEDGNFYLVQEWIAGTNLADKVCQDGPFAPEAVTQLLRDLLPALASVHRNRVIHRDIKPDNIILRDSDGLPVLIDFGAVKEVMSLADNDTRPATKTVVVGTPSYMAPEQAVGRPVYASDLYSLALTAVHLLTGRSPQELPDDPQTGEILWRESLPSLRGPLAAVLDKSLCFHPRDRFASAEDMLNALSGSSRRLVLPLPPIGSFASGSSLSIAALSATATRTLARQQGRKRFLALAAAAIAVTAVGSGVAGFRFTAMQLLSLSEIGAPSSVPISPIIPTPRYQDPPVPEDSEEVAAESVAHLEPSLAGDELAPTISTPERPDSLIAEDAAAIAAESVESSEPDPVGGGLMRAAWYGPGYHGNRTANGETFSRWAHTAAHPTWPFGTQVRVTNPQNGRSSLVRINDRSGESLDVSEQVAAELGFKEQGVADLDVNVVRWGDR